MADESNAPKKPSGRLGDLVTAEGLIQVAFVLPIACLLGAGAGWLLDRHFGTSWVIVVGIALGAAAGLVSTVRTASRYLDRSGK